MRFRVSARLALLVPGLLAASSSWAQVTPHTRTVPKILTGAYGNLDVAAPGVSFWRAQGWYDGKNLPNGFTIREIGFRQSPRNASPGFSGDMTIIMENSSLAFSQVSSAFANNLTVAAQVVFSGSVSAPAMPVSSDPNTAVLWVTLDTPFVVSGPNLIVDIDVENQIGFLVADGLNQVSQSNMFLRAGSSCGGDLSASDAAVAGGFTYDYAMTGAAPSAPAALLFSTENVAAMGLRFPVDLGQIGLAGCELGLLPQAVVPLATDPTGSATLSATVGVPPYFTLSTQAVHGLNPATTNVINTIGGDAELANATTDTGGRRFGPKSYNVALIYFVR